MDIPYSELSEDVLNAVIEEFVTREGTEYGEREYSLSEKIEQIKKQLRDGEIKISFDPESESCTLVSVR